MSIKQLAFAVVAALGVTTAQASIMTNGGFESGLTGWSCSTSSGGCYAGTQGPSALEGSNYFFGFDNAGPGTLWQALTTDIGGIYSISLVFNTNGSVPPNTLSISVGNLSESLAVVTGAWETFSGTFSASATSTDLDFLFSTTGGTGTLWIDAVSISKIGDIGSIPEPTSMALFGLGLAGLAAARRRKAQ